MKQFSAPGSETSRQVGSTHDAITKSYRYSGSPSFFCKIDAVPQPPATGHAKGWSPAQQRKLDRLKNRVK